MQCVKVVSFNARELGGHFEMRNVMWLGRLRGWCREMWCLDSQLTPRQWLQLGSNMSHRATHVTQAHTV
jgi:hypothetical protein